MADPVENFFAALQQAFNTNPYALTAEAILSIMCFKRSQNLPTDPVALAEVRANNNYDVSVWMNYARGASPSIKQRRLIDALTLESLAIERESTLLQQGLQPLIDRRLLLAPVVGQSGNSFDQQRQQIFTKSIPYALPTDGGYTIVPIEWFDMSPAINGPQLVFVDKFPITQEEWQRDWRNIAEDEATIQSLENSDICTQLAISLIRGGDNAVYITGTELQQGDRVGQLPSSSSYQLAIQQPVVESPAASPEERLTPPAKRPAIEAPSSPMDVVSQQLVTVQSRPEQRAITTTVIQQAASANELLRRERVSDAARVPPEVNQIGWRKDLPPPEQHACYLCKEICVPETVQEILASSFAEWESNFPGVDVQSYLDIVKNNPNTTAHLTRKILAANLPNVTEDDAQMYAQWWADVGAANFVANLGTAGQTMRYYFPQCDAGGSETHKLAMCHTCIAGYKKHPAIRNRPTVVGGGGSQGIVRALPVLENIPSEGSQKVSVSIECPLNCRRRTGEKAFVKKLVPFEASNPNEVFADLALTCSVDDGSQCYKPSQWDDSLIGPYSLYLDNLCFYRSGFQESSDENLFVGIVLGYDTEHASAESTPLASLGSTAARLRFGTPLQAQFPKRILVEAVFPAPPTVNQMGQPVKQIESIPINEVFPITVIPENVRGGQPAPTAVRRRFASLQIAVQDAQILVNQLNSAPSNNVVKNNAELRLRQLQKLLAETVSSLPQQIEKLDQLLKVNQERGGSSLLLKQRGIAPTLSMQGQQQGTRTVSSSREMACDICCSLVPGADGSEVDIELVRAAAAASPISALSTSSGSCPVQLQTNGNEYQVPVASDFKYRVRTPVEIAQIRTSVLMNLLNLFGSGSQWNPQYYNTLLQFAFGRNNRVDFRQMKYTVIQVILGGLSGVKIDVPKRVLTEPTGGNNNFRRPSDKMDNDFNPSADASLYDFLRRIWDETFTVNDPSAAWPQPTSQTELVQALTLPLPQSDTVNPSNSNQTLRTTSISWIEEISPPTWTAAGGAIYAEVVLSPTVQGGLFVLGETEQEERKAKRPRSQITATASRTPPTPSISALAIPIATQRTAIVRERPTMQRSNAIQNLALALPERTETTVAVQPQRRGARPTTLARQTTSIGFVPNVTSQLSTSNAIASIAVPLTLGSVVSNVVTRAPNPVTSSTVVPSSAISSNERARILNIQRIGLPAPAPAKQPSSQRLLPGPTQPSTGPIVEDLSPPTQQSSQALVPIGGISSSSSVRPLSEIVPYLQEWVRELLIGAQLPQTEANINDATRWLDFKRGIILGMNIPSLQWVNIDPSLRKNMIDSFVNDLRNRIQ